MVSYLLNSDIFSKMVEYSVVAIFLIGISRSWHIPYIPYTPQIFHSKKSEATNSEYAEYTPNIHRIYTIPRC